MQEAGSLETWKGIIKISSIDVLFHLNGHIQVLSITDESGETFPPEILSDRGSGDGNGSGEVMDILCKFNALFSLLFETLCFAPFFFFHLPSCVNGDPTQSQLQPVLGGLVTVGRRIWGTEDGLDHFVAAVGEHR